MDGEQLDGGRPLPAGSEESTTGRRRDQQFSADPVCTTGPSQLLNHSTCDFTPPFGRTQKKSEGAGSGISDALTGRLFRPLSAEDFHYRGLRWSKSGEPIALVQTSSFFVPIRVRNRSASRLASNGFLNVSLMAERSKLIGFPSSGNKAIKIVSVKSVFLRRF